MTEDDSHDSPQIVAVSLVAQNGPENWHLATFDNKLVCLCNYNNNNNSLFNSLAVTYWINELYYIYISAYIKYKLYTSHQNMQSHLLKILKSEKYVGGTFL